MNEGGDGLYGLMQASDDGFIEGAYRTLLGRQPDPEGLANFHGRLRHGISRLRILGEIAESPEGVAKASRVAGLRSALFKARLASLPVVGGILGRLLRVEGDSPGERRMRAIEYQMRRLSISTMPRMRRIQHATARLRLTSSARLESQTPESWREERAQLLAEHSADRKVLAIEQAESRKFIDSLQERSRRAEEYALSLEQERGHWRAAAEAARAECTDTARRIALLETELMTLRSSAAIK